MSSPDSNKENNIEKTRNLIRKYSRQLVDYLCANGGHRKIHKGNGGRDSDPTVTYYTNAIFALRSSIGEYKPTLTTEIRVINKSLFEFLPLPSNILSTDIEEAIRLYQSVLRRPEELREITKSQLGITTEYLLDFESRLNACEVFIMPAYYVPSKKAGVKGISILNTDGPTHTQLEQMLVTPKEQVANFTSGVNNHLSGYVVDYPINKLGIKGVFLVDSYDYLDLSICSPVEGNPLWTVKFDEESIYIIGNYEGQPLHVLLDRNGEDIIIGELAGEIAKKPIRYDGLT